MACSDNCQQSHLDCFLPVLTKTSSLSSIPFSCVASSDVPPSVRNEKERRAARAFCWTARLRGSSCSLRRKVQRCLALAAPPHVWPATHVAKVTVSCQLSDRIPGRRVFVNILQSMEVQHNWADIRNINSWCGFIFSFICLHFHMKHPNSTGKNLCRSYCCRIICLATLSEYSSWHSYVPALRLMLPLMAGAQHSACNFWDVLWCSFFPGNESEMCCGAVSHSGCNSPTWKGGISAGVPVLFEVIGEV